MTTYGVFGAGGYGREVIPLVRDMIAASPAPDDRVVFVVEGDVTEREVNGYPVLSSEEFFAAPGERRFNIAIGDSKVRARIAAACESQGILAFSIIAASAEILDANEIGVGAILSSKTIITSNARIGRFFHSNIYAYVAHDCIVGDFVTFAPSVKCNGNVTIGDHAYIGTGAILRQGSKAKPLVIGEGAVVGMGAVVTKDVAPFTTVVGNPARVLEKK
ncbi:NeuD/PglB/VioB family sugar acetyltransferase [Dyella subtropica]|uniref:NeuD/PglB/VioB family sugar acetyltransferase n=1 Tax=Dyella subtropica TaxID=2992127 RepID=UPI00225BB962|nr:NeuD/PglB/VioB family sugar acetyltransferase [Dyella subtropica]